MTDKEQELRQAIESLQFTVMTPAPVTVTLGESQITDDILALFTKHTAAVADEAVQNTLRTIHKTIVDNDVAGPVKWQVEDMQTEKGKTT